MWYKGNLHTHTTDSDGDWAPEEVVRRYKARGYDFLAISDHHLYTDYHSQYGDEHFLILPAVEAAASLIDGGGIFRKVHHMNGILGPKALVDAAPLPPLRHGERVGPFRYHGSWDGLQAAADMAKYLKDRGMIVTYNHPIWSRVEGADFLDTPCVDILEILNYGTEQESCTGFDTTWWDVMLRSGRRMMADAADDAHAVSWDAFGGFIMVRAESLTQEAVSSAILAGDYYSSEGPEIWEWSVDGDGLVRLVCSPCERLTLVFDGYVGAGRTRFAEAGEYVEEITFRLKGGERYVRGECRDRQGKRAWTNPIYLDGRQPAGK